MALNAQCFLQTEYSPAFSPTRVRIYGLYNVCYVLDSHPDTFWAMGMIPRKQSLAVFSRYCQSTKLNSPPLFLAICYIHLCLHIAARVLSDSNACLLLVVSSPWDGLLCHQFLLSASPRTDRPLPKKGPPFLGSDQRGTVITETHTHTHTYLAHTHMHTHMDTHMHAQNSKRYTIHMHIPADQGTRNRGIQGDLQEQRIHQERVQR